MTVIDGIKHPTTMRRPGLLRPDDLLVRRVSCVSLFAFSSLLLRLLQLSCVKGMQTYSTMWTGTEDQRRALLHAA